MVIYSRFGSLVVGFFLHYFWISLDFVLFLKKLFCPFLHLFFVYVCVKNRQQKGLWTGLYKKSDNTTLWHGCTPSLRSPDSQFCYKAGADFTLFPADCNEELQYICQLNDGNCLTASVFCLLFASLVFLWSFLADYYFTPSFLVVCVRQSSDNERGRGC